MFSTQFGHLSLLEECVTLHGQASAGAAAAVRQLVAGIPMTRGSIRGKQWLIAAQTGDQSQCADICTCLLESCSLVSCFHLAPALLVAVVSRRARLSRTFPAAAELPQLKFYGIGDVGSSTITNGKVFNAFKFLLAGSTGGVGNVGVHLASAQDPLEVVREWMQLDPADIQLRIIEARLVPPSQRTPRQTLIATGHEQLMKSMMLRVEKNNPLVVFWDTTMKLQEFSNLQLLQCRSFDPQTGNDVSYSLLDWVNECHYTKHTLILFGEPKLGKTPLAMALCGRIAFSLQHARRERPVFLKAGTLDSLRGAAALMVANTPFLLDEWTPMEPKGSRAPSTLEEIKKVCNCETSSSIDARRRDLTTSADQPRVVTSNARDPSSWHDSLPADPWSLTPQQRVQLISGPVRAFFKRAVFCVLSVSVVSAEFASVWSERKRLLHVAKMRRCMASMGEA